MSSLSTLIKFVSAGNGGLGGGDASNAATAGVATGDVALIIAGVVLALLGIFACGAVRRYATSTGGAHAQTNSKISAPIIAAFVSVLLGLTLSVVGATQMKAHADTNDTLQVSGDIIGTVDEQSGEVLFSTVDITNTSDIPQQFAAFQLEAAEGVSTINDVKWTIKAGDEVVHDGPVGEAHELEKRVIIAAGATVKLTVSATDLTADLAKSLIGKEIVNATSYYYDQTFTVSATANPQGSAIITNAPIEAAYGTTYELDSTDNRTIRFSNGETISCEDNNGYEFINWTLNGTAISTGTVTSDLAFVVNEEPPSSFVSASGVRYYPIFAENSVPADFKFYYKNEDNSYTEIMNVTKMSDLNTYKDNLYYRNNGSDSIACVSAFRESFNNAFGTADEGVAATAEDNKAVKYKGSFADKDVAGVECVPLRTDWFCENEDTTSISWQGKYGPGKNFKFTEQSSTVVPKVFGLELTSIPYYGPDYFCSCVTHGGNPTFTPWVFDAGSAEWDDGLSRDTEDIYVLFTRSFS